MQSVTVNLPDSLAEYLIRHEENLPEILDLGVREFELDPQQHGFAGPAHVLRFLAALPSAEETLRLRASKELDARTHQLLEKNKSTGLSPAENEEWRRYEFAEHLVRIAKAKACTMLGSEQAEAILTELDTLALDA